MLKIKTMNEPQSYAPKVTIVDSTAWHVARLKNSLRPEDVQEIMSFGVTVQHGLWVSYRRSLVRKTVFIDDDPVAMFGCQGTLGGAVGKPWLLTSPDVRKVSPLRFARVYQEQVTQMLELFPSLVNYVDTSYTAAIRLLDIIGFTVDEPEQMGNGMFCRFWIGK